VGPVCNDRASALAAAARAYAADGGLTFDRYLAVEIHERPAAVVPSAVSLGGFTTAQFPEADASAVRGSSGTPGRLQPWENSPIVIWYRRNSSCAWYALRGFPDAHEAHVWIEETASLRYMGGQYEVRPAGPPPGREVEGLPVPREHPALGAAADSRAARPPYRPDLGRQVAGVAEPPARVGGVPPAAQSFVPRVPRG
jgi:hypothetical protein